MCPNFGVQVRMVLNKGKAKQFSNDLSVIFCSGIEAVALKILIDTGLFHLGVKKPCLPPFFLIKK